MRLLDPTDGFAAVAFARQDPAGALADQLREFELQRLEAARKAQEAQSRASVTQSRIAASASQANQKLASRTQLEVAEMNNEVSREEIASRLTIAREQLGFNREELAARVGLENERLVLARDELEALIGKYEADAWYQRKQVELTQDAHKIERASIGLEHMRGLQQLDIQRGQLGLGYLEAASKLRGPEDWAQFLDFQRGASQRQDVPIFMQALMNNVTPPGYTGAPGGMAAPVTAAGMVGGLSGGQVTGAQPGYAGGLDPVQAYFLKQLGVPQHMIGAMGGQPSGTGGPQDFAMPPGERGSADDWDAWLKANRGRLEQAGIAPPPESAEYDWQARNYRDWWASNAPAPPAAPAQQAAAAQGVNVSAAQLKALQDQQAYDAGVRLYGRGVAGWAPGSWESLPSAERGMLTSIWEHAGGDAPRWLRDYTASRFVQGSPFAG